MVRVDYLYDEIPWAHAEPLFMSNIIHSEDETDNVQLARKCFSCARGPGGNDDYQGSHHECRPDRSRGAGCDFALYLLMATRRGATIRSRRSRDWLGGRRAFIDIRLEVVAESAVYFIYGDSAQNR